MIYLKNNGTATIRLSMYAGNWTPTEAVEQLSLSWNRENTTMVADEILMATLTLDVAVNVTKSMKLTFDITIIGVAI